MTPVLRVTTESGTIYTLDCAAMRVEGGCHLRGKGRVLREGGGPMRGDGAWLPCAGIDLPGVGHPMRMILTVPDEGGLVDTIRTTTPVVTIETIREAQGV